MVPSVSPARLSGLLLYLPEPSTPLSSATCIAGAPRLNSQQPTANDNHNHNHNHNITHDNQRGLRTEIHREVKCLNTLRTNHAGRRRTVWRSASVGKGGARRAGDTDEAECHAGLSPKCPLTECHTGLSPT